MNPKELFKPVNYFVVDYDVLEQYVCEIYGISDYEICASIKCLNDTEYSYQISKPQSDVERGNIAIAIDNLKKTGLCYPASVLTDLCDKGLIGEGYYLIKVSW